MMAAAFAMGDGMEIQFPYETTKQNREPVLAAGGRVVMAVGDVKLQTHFT